MMKRIILSLGLLFCSADIFGTYSVGTLDTLADGGAGFGEIVSQAQIGFTTTILSGVFDSVNAVAVQSDGKVVAVGQAGTAAGMARYTIDGILDTTFGTGGTFQFNLGATTANIAYGVAIQPDGKIVVTGTANDVGTISIFVARFLEDGTTLDITFNNSGISPSGQGYVIQTFGAGTNIAFCVVLQKEDGKIVIAGQSGDNMFIARYTVSGVLDSSTTGGNIPFVVGVGYIIFTPSGYISFAQAITIDDSGNIIVAGSATSEPYHYLLATRYSSAGIQDTTFNGGGTPGYGIYNPAAAAASYSYGIALQKNGTNAGKIVIAGAFGTYAGLMRLTRDGVLDTSTTAGNVPFGPDPAEGYIINNFGGSAVAYGLVLQEDDKIVIAGNIVGAGSNFLIARFLENGTGLDTSFGISSGYTSTQITFDGDDSGATCLAMQPNGEFVVAGYAKLLGVLAFAVARYLGTQDIQGAMDFYYPTTVTGSDILGYVTYPTGQISTDLSQIISTQALSNNQLLVLSNNNITPYDSYLTLLNSDGSVAATMANALPQGAQSVIVDSFGRPVIVGGNIDLDGWLARCVISGSSITLDPAFNSGHLVVNAGVIQFDRLAQEASGNYIVMGNSSGPNGSIFAYDLTGTLISEVFGNGGIFTDLLVANSFNGTYAINNVWIGVVGSSYLYLQNTIGATSGSNLVLTGLSTSQYDGLPYIAFDNTVNQNVILGVSDSNSGILSFRKYRSSSPFASMNSLDIEQSINLLTSPCITMIQCDTDNRIVFSGYDNNVFFIGRVLADFSGLDTTFAPYSSTPGILKTTYNDNNPIDATIPARVLNSVGISPNGSIQFGGYESIDASHSVSLVGQIIGEAGVTENARFPKVPGELNTNFNSTGTNPGFMNLHTELNATISHDFVVPTIADIVLQNADGSYFIAANAANGYITKMTNLDVQDTTFAASTNNILIITSTSIQAMMIDQAGNLVMLGTAGQLKQFNATTGDEITSFIVTNHLDLSTAIAQQSDGRYIVVGMKDDRGALIAYNSVTGAVDTTFGSNGIFNSGSTLINSMVIDTTDDIYFVSNDVDTEFPILQSLSADGTLFSDTGTTSIASVGDCSYIAFNPSRNLVIATVAEGSPYIMTIQSFATTLGSPITTLSLPVATTGIVAPLIESMIIDASGNIILTGCDNGSTPTRPFVMRVLANLSGLDTSFTSGSGTPGVVTANAVTNNGAEWRDAFIQANGNITVSGYEITSGATTPYLMRLYGNASVEQYNPSIFAGTPGTINTNFGTDGLVQLNELASSQLIGATALAIAVLPDGYYYVAFDNGHIARFTNGNILDVSYNPTGVNYPAGFAQILTPFGLSSMIIDGDGHLMCVGTHSDSNVAWILQYAADNSGTLNSHFNNGSPVYMDNVVFVQIVQQTLSRYIVVGDNLTSGDATLWAYTNTGVVDTTFNSNRTPGYYATATSHRVAAVIADVYDRLIFAHYVGSSPHKVNVDRLTASGEVDTTFGVSGTIVSAIANATDAIQIRLAFDASGNIIVAANVTINSVQKIAVCAYANGTGTTLVEAELVITGLNIPTLTNLVGTADGEILLAGYQFENDDMWVARVKDNGHGVYALDTTFAPSPNSTPGILQFNFDPGVNVTGRILSSMAIYGDGQIIMVGSETDSVLVLPTILSFVTMAYDTPYTTQELSCQDSQPIGTNDLTLGIQSPPANGVSFFATTNTDPLLYQYAQAVALQDDETIVVAIDGQVTEGGSSQIFINAFNVDGLLDTNFNSEATSPLIPGQALVLSMFDNQYARDMMTFTTVDGIHKAILAGYATSTALGSSNSLLMQYNLDTASLDATFGGCNGDSLGVAVGTGSSQGFTVGRQSMGRIILSGLNLSTSEGLLQGYTTTGVLDQSFGAGGYFTQGATGIYVSVIDSSDRVLIAYNDGFGDLVLARILSDGSGLDQTFGTEGTHWIDYGGAINSNNNFRMVLDQSGNIFVAVVLSSGTEIVVNQLDPNGQGIVASTTFNGSDFSESLINFTIGKLLINNEGALGILGSDSSSILVAQVIINDSNFLALDPNFNTSDTPGYVRYNISTGQQAITYGLIHPDGRYILVGYHPSEPV